MLQRFRIPGLIGLATAGAVLATALCLRGWLSVAAVNAPAVPGRITVDDARQAPGPNDWPSWRGSRGDGIARMGDPPLSWSRHENVDWETPLAGSGHSSPVIWSDAVFLTSADEGSGSLSVLCLDLGDGQIRWSLPVLHGKFPVKHEKNTHASATPACDGNMVYSVFVVDDSAHVVAVTVDGQQAWHTNAGPFISQYGYGSSPVLYDSLVIVSAESRGSHVGRLIATSFMAGLNRKTGEIVWRIHRPEAHGFGSPVVGHIAGRDQLILSGGGEIDSYDPATGKLIWTCKSQTERSANTPVFDDQRVYVSGTYPNSEVICIRADGEGDVTDTHIVWQNGRGASNVPSPVLLDGQLYLLQDKGVLSCLDAISGTTRRQQRLSGNFTASPVVAGGRLYAANELGTTFVVSLDPDLSIVAENELDEPIFASPTPCGSSILIRTSNTLRKISDARSTP